MPFLDKLVSKPPEWQGAVRAATVVALPANTRSGNYLTANVNGALPTVDDVTLAIDDPILVWQEADPVKNGKYRVLDLGSAGSRWLLRRTADFDEQSEVVTGASIPIWEGTNYSGQLGMLTTALPVLGVTGLAFVIDTAGMVPPTIQASRIVQYATTAAIAAHTFDAPTNRITFSSVGAQAVDGTVPLADDRVLYYQEGVANSQFGLYRVVVPGDGTHAAVWQRPPDSDASDEFIPFAVWIQFGTTLATRTAVLTTPQPVVLNTTPLSFALTTAGAKFLDPVDGVVTTATSIATFPLAQPPLAQTGSGPLIAITGPTTPTTGLIVQITTGGTVGGGSDFKWSTNGGASYTTGVPTAASVSVGAFTVYFPAGTYVLNTLYRYSPERIYGINDTALLIAQVAGAQNRAHTVTAVTGAGYGTLTPRDATIPAAARIWCKGGIAAGGWDLQTAAPITPGTTALTWRQSGDVYGRSLNTQYATYWGNDANDGQTLATAKEHPMVCYDELKRLGQTGGRVRIVSHPVNGLWWDPDHTVGSWITAQGDAQFANLPAGFRTGIHVHFEGIGRAVFGQQCPGAGLDRVLGGTLDPMRPNCWISGGNAGTYENLLGGGIGSAANGVGLVVGIDSTFGLGAGNYGGPHMGCPVRAAINYQIADLTAFGPTVVDTTLSVPTSMGQRVALRAGDLVIATNQFGLGGVGGERTAQYGTTNQRYLPTVGQGGALGTVRCAITATISNFGSIPVAQGGVTLTTGDFFVYGVLGHRTSPTPSAAAGIYHVDSDDGVNCVATRILELDTTADLNLGSVLTYVSSGTHAGSVWVCAPYGVSTLSTTLPPAATSPAGSTLLTFTKSWAHLENGLYVALDNGAGAFQLVRAPGALTAVGVATTTALPSYTGGGTNTITASVNGALAIDGIPMAVLNVRILVKNEGGGAGTAHLQNGIYKITTIGTVSVKWVLTRDTDFDSSGEAIAGLLIPCTSGTINGGNSFVHGTTAGVTLNTTALRFDVTDYDATQAAAARALNSDASLATGLRFWVTWGDRMGYWHLRPPKSGAVLGTTAIEMMTAATRGSVPGAVSSSDASTKQIINCKWIINNIGTCGPGSYIGSTYYHEISKIVCQGIDTGERAKSLLRASYFINGAVIYADNIQCQGGGIILRCTDNQAISAECKIENVFQEGSFSGNPYPAVVRVIDPSVNGTVNISMALNADSTLGDEGAEVIVDGGAYPQQVVVTGARVVKGMATVIAQGMTAAISNGINPVTQRQVGWFGREVIGENHGLRLLPAVQRVRWPTQFTHNLSTWTKSIGSETIQAWNLVDQNPVSGPAMTITGDAPSFFPQLLIFTEITAGGTVNGGIAKLKYSLDGGLSYTTGVDVTSVVPLGSTGYTAHFAAGTVVLGVVYTVEPQNDPNGGARAYKLHSGAGVGGLRQNTSSLTLAVGDFFIGGVFVRGFTGSGISQAASVSVFSGNAPIFDTTNVLNVLYRNGHQWIWTAQWLEVTGLVSTGTTQMYLGLSSGPSADHVYFDPMFAYLKGFDPDGHVLWTRDMVAELAQNCGTWSSAAPQGSSALSRGSDLWMPDSRIITSSTAAPTIVAGAGLGTSPPAPTVTGSDTAFRITVTTGTSPAAGVLASIAFSPSRGPWGAVPKVIPTPDGDNAQTLGANATNKTTAGFDLRTPNTPAAATTYIWDVIAIQ